MIPWENGKMNFDSEVLCSRINIKIEKMMLRCSTENKTYWSVESNPCFQMEAPTNVPLCSVSLTLTKMWMNYHWEAVMKSDVWQKYCHQSCKVFKKILLMTLTILLKMKKLQPISESMKWQYHYSRNVTKSPILITKHQNSQLYQN